MNNRVSALLSAATAHARKDDEATKNGPTSETFGSLSLPWQQLAATLDLATAKALEAYVHGHTKMDKATTNTIAATVMKWALGHGATHYAHWFHPLTGVPAEKHDAFLARTMDANPTALESLPGSLFLQSEPDASSSLV